MNIKIIDDLSCHLKLEVEHLEAYKVTKVVRFERAYVANNDSHMPKGPTARIMLLDETLAMDLRLRRQRTPTTSKASTMA